MYGLSIFYRGNFEMNGFLWEIKLIFRSYRQYNTIIQHMAWINIHPSVKNEMPDRKVQGSLPLILSENMIIELNMSKIT